MRAGIDVKIMKFFGIFGILYIFITVQLKEMASEEAINETPAEDEETSRIEIDYIGRIKQVLAENPKKKNPNLQIGKDFNEKRKELEKQLELITRNPELNQLNAAKALINFRRFVRLYGDIDIKLGMALYDLDRIYNKASISSSNLHDAQMLINAILKCDTIGYAKKILEEYKVFKQRIQKNH